MVVVVNGQTNEMCVVNGQVRRDFDATRRLSVVRLFIWLHPPTTTCNMDNNTNNNTQFDKIKECRPVPETAHGRSLLPIARVQRIVKADKVGML